MDIASLIGFFLGILVMIGSILIAPGATLGAFVDYPSLVVVVLGGFCAVLICFPLQNVLGTAKVFKIVFLNKPPNIRDTIQLIVSLAETARRDGLLALESRIADIKDPFLVMGMQMAVDGTPPDVIETVLRNEQEAINGRHKDGKAVLDQYGKFAPAFGMIGTLLGLVIMLGNMADPAAIGPGMAVALLTTLYGAVLSNLIMLPMSEKLNFLNKLEMTALEIVIRGILSVQAGDNPRVIEQKLNTFLSPKQRKAAVAKAAA